MQARSFSKEIRGDMFMLFFNKLPHFSVFLSIAIWYLLTNYSVFAHRSLSFKPSLEYSKLPKINAYLQRDIRDICLCVCIYIYNM